MAKSNGVVATAEHGTNGANHKNRIVDILPPPTVVQITKANMKVASFTIRGTANYVQNKFSAKAREQMIQTQSEGSTSKKGKKRKPKDFDACFREATYLSAKKEYGIPCGAFKAAMVSACGITGFKMTHAKKAVRILSDTTDATDIGTDLVKITKGKPKRFDSAVRNDNGSADIRSRPMWAPGWEAVVRVRFDADVFTLDDIANLLNRAGEQIGVGEGRADSKDSCGMGWGFFEIVNK